MKKKKETVDKLEKVVKEFEDTPFVEEETPFLVDKQVAEVKITPPDFAGMPNWEVVPKNMYQEQKVEQVGMRDTYLPFVLTKLKICANNTEARKMIFNGLVKVNDKVVPPNQGQITKTLSNFRLEVSGKKWEIFKID